MGLANHGQRQPGRMGHVSAACTYVALPLVGRSRMAYIWWPCDATLFIYLCPSSMGNGGTEGGGMSMPHEQDVYCRGCVV
ncbi:hypothetical protein NDU88_010098 [Pleurodeles waltl]|uniref:Uncharacterized protein n=1 Tax=Pleurodeles waltl TaxID=8319 RepID=A0AAV7Q181_PLEWA|nr:hypothetical protein NDU88_010098 [Pleurodeles waltl]